MQEYMGCYTALRIIIVEVIVSLISAPDLYITSIAGHDLHADSPSLTHPFVLFLITMQKNTAISSVNLCNTMLP